MKSKILVYAFIITFLTVLQSILPSYIRIYGVVPNLLLTYVVSNALIKGKSEGALIGLIVGFLFDIISAKLLGVNALIFMYFGMVTGYFYKSLYRESVVTAMFFSCIATFLYNSIMFVIWIYPKSEIGIMNSFFKISLSEMIYNCIGIIIIHKIVLKIEAVNVSYGRFIRKY